MSHEMAVFVIPMLILHHYLIKDRKMPWEFLRILPFLILVGIYLTARHFIAGPTPLTDLDPITLFNSVAVIIKRYLKLFFFPDAPVTTYQYFIGMFSHITWEVIASYITLIMLILVGFLIWFRKRDMLFWYLWFFVFCSITFNVGKLGDYLMAEKLLYLASLGFCVLIATILANGLKNKYILSAIIIALSLIHFSITFSRNFYWKNTTSYLEAALHFAPDFSLGHYALGNEYAASNQYGKAIDEYKKTLILKPDFVFLYEYIKNMHNAQGYHYATNNLYDDALNEFRQSLLIDPNQSDVYNNIGNIFYIKEMNIKALKTWERAIEIDPANSEAYFNMGLLMERQGDKETALIYFKKYLSIVQDVPSSIRHKIDELEKTTE
jgi:Tfp pilus assembly protein PilF